MKKILLAAALALGGGAATLAPSPVEAAVGTCHTRQLTSRYVQTTCTGNGQFALVAECSRLGPAATYYTKDYAYAPYGTAAVACQMGFRITWLQVVR